VTDSQRHTAILALIESYTNEHMSSKAAAHDALYRAGLLTKAGTFRKRYKDTPIVARAQG
jgi:hypothetical protein